MTVRVQYKSFDVGQLTADLHARNPRVGAVVNFIGYVRDLNIGQSVNELFLEHYPGMTEKALEQIADEARERWPLLGVEIVHRVGALAVSEPIVFVGVSSKHRHMAFEACAFIMDVLKTRAPFWKRESTAQGSHWVEARESDQNAALRWSLAHA
ncbi:molybdopterin synthase catalytic subunit MoaE [Pseudomonas sp. RSB 5.4]|jgi:molybdopterin synthase catalytic subunit|uniref:Molybdopterin synthase catalytic subunit n=1 Tax=Pseudomonas fluorescens TaxID=294 RepID=A0AAP8Z2S8_PSEFL|nr:MULTISPECIES: molybdopterin synthase catalytic subunit MoaE [Pseudomonas]EZP26425.1 molybdopterin synthase subunit MoaE [Pseudomonas sp. RIT288]MCO7626127.1 molybdopterin synthase catalytic subunit MoaE [Pseudomonas fluorescens]MCU1770888.1 molybdopterin synthase catalytic subunit MoaE [Pseudomonas sp. 13B_3.2_Bac1]QBX42213.1 molybdopterin synthase catalytic subunit MoaE [Pseudomonas fluorescens]SNY16610.1 molybdopterin synthase subunit MoaE [Pseudomonas sp. LAMO17WK12:I5]